MQGLKVKMAAVAYTDPIPFVKASKCVKIPSVSRGNVVKDTSEQLSGYEARTFYERVVSDGSVSKDGGDSAVRKDSTGAAPHDNSVRGTTKNLKAQALKRKRSAPSAQGAPSPSASQLFLFAQEGMLNELREALFTSTRPCMDLNTKDMYGWSLLMSSAYAGHHDIVCFLLSKGAEWEGVCDKQGRTAVDLALMAGHRRVADEIQAYSMSGINVEKGRTNEVPTASMCAEALPTSQVQEQQLPFFCSLCSVAVRESTEEKHTHSTLHQFNCQHHPNVHQYGIPMSNKGYKLLVKGGWDPERGLGQSSDGKQFPVKTVLKRDRLGLGADEATSARVTHFGPCDTTAVCEPNTKRLARGGKLKEQRLSKKQKREGQRMKGKRWEIALRRYMNGDY